jgi:hypothetical protein
MEHTCIVYQHIYCPPFVQSLIDLDTNYNHVQMKIDVKKKRNIFLLYTKYTDYTYCFHHRFYISFFWDVSSKGDSLTTRRFNLKK